MSRRNHSSFPILLIALIVFGLFTFDCKPEEEIVDLDFPGGLQFSRDTVLFDTVFSGIGSATRRLQVFNPSQNAQKIRQIWVGGGASSPFEVLINGSPIDDHQQELTLLGKDSVLLLIEVLIDPHDEDSPYLVNDSIVFETNLNTQNVKLVAWGQDANYLGDIILPCDAAWNKDRPYVLYSSILVDTLCHLTISDGTRIFAAKDAYIYVKGTINATGTTDERILFRNERLDPAYENIPGQWGGILFLEGSKDNVFEYTSIRNASFGIYLDAPDQDTIPTVVLKNVIIENMSNSGIINFSSDLYAENTLVNNCIEFNCANIGGGNYTYKHCTFANYSLNLIRQSPSFYISDNLVNDGSTIVMDVMMTMQNTIVYGDQADEIYFDNSGGGNLYLAFNNNIFKSTIQELDTLDNILNQDPKFIDPSQYNYRLDTLSPAKDAGALIGVLTDLDGNDRDDLPDIGAYERIE